MPSSSMLLPQSIFAKRQGGKVSWRLPLSILKGVVNVAMFCSPAPLKNAYTTTL
jgi:hypothetical protein